MKQKIDLMNGNILQGILFFSIPLLISNIFQQLYNAVDTMVVGNYLGDASLAAIGSSAAIFELLVGFAMGVATGVSIVSARAYGSGNKALLKKSVCASLVIGFICSILLTVIAQVSLYPLLELLGTPANIIDEAYSYIHFISLFIFVMFAYNLFAALLRAVGNSIAPLLFLIVSSLLNIVLDIWFITGLNMGIRGAAVATVIAQAVSTVLVVIYIKMKVPELSVKLEDVVWDKDMVLELLGQGLSMGFMSSIVSIGSVILQSGINSLGYLVIAGHTAARKVFGICMIPFGSLGMALSTFVSQNKGANQMDRIKKGVNLCNGIDIGIAAAITVIMLLCSKSLMQTMSGSTESIVIQNGVLYLNIAAPFYAALGILFNLRFSLQGIGRKVVPLISSVIELVGKILFTIWIIPSFGYMGVIFCEPIIWCVMAIQLAFTFYRDPIITGKTIETA